MAERRSSLTSYQELLLTEMQRIGHGRIECLVVRHGQPVLEPKPAIIRDIKFGADNGPRPECALSDFALKAAVRDLFAHLDALGDGTVRRLEIKHGLPFRMEIEEVIA